MARVDDLAPLLGGQPGGGVGFRQGTVVSFNQQTGQNVINVGGTLLTDLPMFNLNEVALLVPDAVVGILTWQPGNGAASWFILGTIATPQGSGWKSATAIASVAATETTTSTTYTDLATSGPAVTVYIGRSGSALVTMYATLNPTTSDGPKMSVAISGATTRGADHFDTKAYSTLSGTQDQVSISACGLTLLKDLNPGSNVFTAKYRSTFGASVSIGNRTLVVTPL